MKRKKQFVSPRVLKQVEVCLEGDLLVVGPSVQYHTEITAAPILTEEADLSDEETYELFWD